MNADEFVNWLGIELHRLVQIPIDSNRFEATRDLVNRAVSMLIGLPPSEQKQVVGAIITAHQSGRIGDYRIPYDIRDEFDMIEEVLATIEGLID